MKVHAQNFCVLPWVQQMANPAGFAGLCCVANSTEIINQQGQLVELGKVGLQPAWNASSLRGIREKMSQNLPVKACGSCQNQEKLGKKSFRQIANSGWSEMMGADRLQKLVDDSAKNQFFVEQKPISLDLRLGNLCNLKCRMCNPFNSVMIHKEWSELDQESAGQYSKFWKKYTLENKSIDPWYESQVFWQSCEKLIPSLERIYFAGGEPTLILPTYDFLKTCIAAGRADQISLAYNVNGTQLSDELLDLISQFKLTNLVFSVDGIGALGEYIRYPSKWTSVENNIHKALERAHPNITVGISPVAQIYNILNMTELFQWVEQLESKYSVDIPVQVSICEEPAFLSLQALPSKIKLAAFARLQDYALKFQNPSKKIRLLKADYLINGINSLMEVLGQKSADDGPLFQDFLKYTELLDKKRGQKLLQACPELYYSIF